MNKEGAIRGMRNSKAFAIFMLVLMVFSTVIEPMGAFAAERPDVEPDIKFTKEVDGKSSKEVDKGKDFIYSSTAKIPKDLGSLETVIIKDVIDKGFKFVDEGLLVEGEEEKTSKEVKDEPTLHTYKLKKEEITLAYDVEVKGQVVSVELDREQLEQLKGKDLTLDVKLQLEKDIKEVKSSSEILTDKGTKFVSNEVTVTQKEEVKEEVKKDSEPKKEESKNVSKKEVKETIKVEKKDTKEVKKETKVEPEEDLTKENLARDIMVRSVIVDGKLTTDNAPVNPKSMLDVGAVVAKENEYISNKYGVIPIFKDGVSKLEITGVETKEFPEDDKDSLYIIAPSDNLKGKIKATYKRVASYKGQDLDYEFLLDDWKKAGFEKFQEKMRFRRDVIGYSQAGYEWISIKGKFKYTDTGKDATDIPGFYMTIMDLDARQSMVFSKSQYSKIDKMYVDKDTLVKQWERGNRIHMGADFKEDLDTTDPVGHVTVLVDGYTFDYRWEKHWLGYRDREYAGIPTKFMQYFAYGNTKPLRTEPVEPEKYVTDGDEKKAKENTLSNLDEEFVYDIYHNVPYEVEKYRFKDYVLEDDINPALEIKNVKVTNYAGKDVTRQFRVDTKDNKLKISARASELKKESFYEETYKYQITVKVKDVKMLDKYINEKEGIIEVPNYARVVIDGKSARSNRVITKIPLQAPETVKTVENKKLTDVSYGDEIKYNIRTKVPENITGVKKIQVKDPIDKRLKIESVKLLSNGKESDIEVTVKDNVVQYTLTGKELEKYKGKELNLEIITTIKKGIVVDTLDNVAEVFINDGPINITEPVTITPKQDLLVEKEWEDDTKYDRPSSIKVNLLANGKKVDEGILEESKGWKYVFKGLSKVDKNGKEIIYTIEEEKVPGYTGTITGNDMEGFKIVNKFKKDVPNPKLEKDANGKKDNGNKPALVIPTEKTFDYNVKTKLPSNLIGYFDMNITDVLDNRLDVKGAELYVGGNKINKKVTINGQTVRVDFTRDELEPYKGKEVELKIKAQIKKGTKVELIDNDALIQVNDNPKTRSNKVHVKPSQLELSMHKIQIYTAPKDKGLPVKLDLKVDKKGTGNTYNNEPVKIGIYEKTNGLGVKVATINTTIGKLEGLETTIKTGLSKAGVKRYEARIDEINEDVLSTEVGKDRVDTDGHVSTEKEIEIDMKDPEAGLVGSKEKINNGKYSYKDVIMTERILGENITKKYEELTITLDEIGKQKSGYGVEVNRDVVYKNELGDGTEEIEAEVEVDEALLNTYLEYEVKNGNFKVGMDSKRTQKTNNDNSTKTEEYSFKLPHVNVEYKTGNLFSDKQVERNDERITDELKDGGNKLYVPIWIDELGKYNVNFQSKKGSEIGVHQIEFKVLDEIDVTAYMYGHIGSETIKEDEILIQPANLGNIFTGNVPSDWSEEDIEWLKGE